MPRPVHPQALYANLLVSAVRPGMRWLDIGCGGQIVPDWALRLDQQKQMLNGVTLVGLDVDDAIHRHPFLSEKLIGLADDIPAPSESFDLVTANMVMEHVTDPDTVLKSVHRVLRNGGKFILHTPNYRFYLIYLASLTPDFLKRPLTSFLDKRDESDIFPTVYRFNTPDAVSAIAQRCGFAVEQLQIVGPYPTFWRVPVLRSVESAVNSIFLSPSLEGYRSNLLVILKKQ